MSSQPNDYSFDLDEEMVQQLGAEFGPESLKKEMAKALGDKADDAATTRFFEDFGRRWMERSIELGEEHPDRTYEVLKETIKKIPEYSFPFISQRYIEIAYLCTQPIYTVPIAENGMTGLVYKMPFCGYHSAIQEAKGEEFADQLQCKGICLSACEKAFNHFGHEVRISMDTTMTDDGVCQFSVRKA